MKKLYLIGASALACAATPVFAQSAETPDSQGLGDIVVTAQRRSEKLQNVPISVTALSSDQLARSGVSSVLDLGTSVPTLNISNSNGNLSTSLRGVGSTSVNPGFENPVALYVD